VTNNKGSLYPMSQESRCSDRIVDIRWYLIAEASFLQAYWYRERARIHEYLVCAGCRMLGYTPYILCQQPDV